MENPAPANFAQTNTTNVNFLFMRIKTLGDSYNNNPFFWLLPKLF
jgi:hypothetical protein